MKRYRIRTPIWATRSIGISTDKLQDDLLVEITYKNKFGSKIYPDVYIIRKGFADKYPEQIISGIVLKLIPIGRLEVYEKKEILPKKERKGNIKRINKFLKGIEKKGQISLL